MKSVQSVHSADTRNYQPTPAVWYVPAGLKQATVTYINLRYHHHPL